MNPYRLLENNRGFTLVQAIFILVVLALLGVAITRLISVQSSTNLLAVQGGRAYQAARSGLEWGAARARVGAVCDGTMTIHDFSVTVSCAAQSFSEGAIGPYPIFTISAKAIYGSYGSPDYVSRGVQMKVGFP